jgi:hypothetical protein
MAIATIPAPARRTATRAALVGLAAFGLLTSVAGAAGDESGLVDDFAYESPTYGYEIEWDRPWEVDTQESYSQQGIDTLWLDSFGGFLQVVGFTTDWTAEQIVEDNVDNVDEMFDDPEVLAQGAGDGVAYSIISGESDGRTLVQYYEVREIAEGEGGEPALVTITVLYSTEETFENNAASVAADVQIEGDPAFLTLDAAAAAAENADEDTTDSRSQDDQDEENDRGNRNHGHDADRSHDDDEDEDAL